MQVEWQGKVSCTYLKKEIKTSIRLVLQKEHRVTKSSEKLG